MTPRLIPIAEAARLAGGVSVRTLEREHAAGRLAIVRIRARRFITEAELDRYITAQTTCPSASSATAGRSASVSDVADALSALLVNGRGQRPEVTEGTQKAPRMGKWWGKGSPRTGDCAAGAARRFDGEAEPAQRIQAWLTLEVTGNDRRDHA